MDQLFDPAQFANMRAAIGDANVARLLAMFCDELKTGPGALTQAIINADTRTARARAHSLKGAAAGMGAAPLAAAAARIEDALRAGNDPSRLVGAMTTTARATLDAANALLAQLGSAPSDPKG